MVPALPAARGRDPSHRGGSVPCDATLCRHGFSRSVAHDARKELAVHARRKGILGRQIWGISFTYSPYSGLRLPSHSRIDKGPEVRWACIGRSSLSRTQGRRWTEPTVAGRLGEWRRL